MPGFEISDQARKIRSHRGTQFYMGSHPAIRRFMRGKRRPRHFGDRVWNSTRHLLDALALARPATVLDMGCGWGVIGVHLARACGASVTCVDLDERLEPIVRAHADLNGVSVGFRAAGLAQLTDVELSCELIVGSDICFSEEIAAELIGVIDRASGAGAGRVLIADSGRPDFEHLIRHCKQRYECSVTRAGDQTKSDSCHILSIDFPQRAPD